jgi:hypothetical protein
MAARYIKTPVKLASNLALHVASYHISHSHSGVTVLSHAEVGG